MLEASVFNSHQQQDAFLHSAQFGSEAQTAQTASYPMGTGYIFGGGKLAGAWS
jgi:hypothetical protein